MAKEKILMRRTSNEDEIHFNDPINHVVKFKDLKTSISRLDFRVSGRRLIFVPKKISEKKIMDQNLILWADESPSDRNKLKQEVPSKQHHHTPDLTQKLMVNCN